MPGRESRGAGPVLRWLPWGSAVEPPLGKAGKSLSLPSTAQETEVLIHQPGRASSCQHRGEGAEPGEGGARCTQLVAPARAEGRARGTGNQGWTQPACLQDW